MKNIIFTEKHVLKRFAALRVKLILMNFQSDYLAGWS